MSIHYICRYCRYHLGQIKENQATEQQLGFYTLTMEERNGIIRKEDNGDTYAHVICEHCQETVERYPELLLQSSILQ